MGKEDIMGAKQKKQQVKRGGAPSDGLESTQGKIRALAYQLYCECGCEHGHDLEHWCEAERRVLGQVQAEHDHS